MRHSTVAPVRLRRGYYTGSSTRFLPAHIVDQGTPLYSCWRRGSIVPRLSRRTRCTTNRGLCLALPVSHHTRRRAILDKLLLSVALYCNLLWRRLPMHLSIVFEFEDDSHPAFVCWMHAKQHELRVRGAHGIGPRAVPCAIHDRRSNWGL